MTKTMTLLPVIAITALFASPVHAAGDQVSAGLEVYKTQRCSMCHKVNGAGGKNGPDLSSVGTTRDAAWLKAYLVNPKAENPKNKMPPVKASAADLDALVSYLRSLKAGK